MKFGLMYGGAGPWASRAGALALATQAEGAGFNSLWAVDHAIVNSDSFDETYSEKGGSWEFTSEYPIADPMGWLSFAAAVTTKIELCTGIVIAPIRPPVILANQAATLDVLSQGRLRLGVGAGWVADELTACGVPFEERVARLEEGIAVMRELWAGPAASYQGDFTSFDRMTLSPRPAAGRIPVILGGRVRAAAERAGRIGDGFFPHTRDVERLKSLFEIAQKAAEKAGRDPAELSLVAGGARTADDLAALEAIGVTDVIFSPRARSIEELGERLGSLMCDLIAPFVRGTTNEVV